MAEKFQIAGLTVSMECRGETLRKRAARYQTQTDRPADIEIAISDERIQKAEQAHPELNFEQWEYMLAGSDFYTRLLDFQGMLLHASAVVADGQAYLFSADSGTGKSTHTTLWLKHFGDRAYILNDDKPAIRLIDGAFYAYGTPFSGKDDISQNRRAPLAGVAFLTRAQKNVIEPLKGAGAIRNFMAQTIRKLDKTRMTALLDLLNALLQQVPVYQFGCNISDAAVTVAYEAMRREQPFARPDGLG